MRRKKKLFIVIGIVVFVFLIVPIISGLIRGKSNGKVKAVIAKNGNIVSKVRADGTLKGLNQVQIGSEVMGKIVEMRVREGDKVRKGDILCMIDQSTYASRAKRALAAFRLSESRLIKAATDLERSMELFKSGLVSKENYEAVKLSYETAVAEVKSNEESYNEAKSTLEKTTITSPVAGEVIQRNKEEGEMAIVGTISTPGSVIMTIADRSRMFVKALVDETEIVKIELNQSVVVKIDAFPDTVFQGKVVKIGGLPTGSGFGGEEAVNFPIEVGISGAPEKLYPGMSASCEIWVGGKDSVIVLPYMALGRRKIKGKEEDIVILLKEDKAKCSPVRLGLTGEEGVEIIEGISAGDTVLTGPYKKLRELKEGDRVEVEVKSKLKPVPTRNPDLSGGVQKSKMRKRIRKGEVKIKLQ